MSLKENVALCFKEHNIIRKVLADWLDCADTPEELARCRNNAKIVLGRSADPEELNFKTHNKAVEFDGAKMCRFCKSDKVDENGKCQNCGWINPPRNSL